MTPGSLLIAAAPFQKFGSPVTELLREQPASTGAVCITPPIKACWQCGCTGNGPPSTAGTIAMASATIHEKCSSRMPSTRVKTTAVGTATTTPATTLPWRFMSSSPLLVVKSHGGYPEIACQLGAGNRSRSACGHCRTWGRSLVVVRGRKSRPHGEGGQ